MHDEIPESSQRVHATGTCIIFASLGSAAIPYFRSGSCYWRVIVYAIFKLNQAEVDLYEPLSQEEKIWNGKFAAD